MGYRAPELAQVCGPFDEADALESLQDFVDSGID